MTALHRRFAGLLALAMLAGARPAGAGEEVFDCRFTGDVQGDRPPRARWLTRDGLFRPLLAGTREPRFGGGLHGVRALSTSLDGGLLGGGHFAGWIELGGGVALVSYRPADGCDGIAVRLEAGIASQFDLTSESNDLVNTDYLVGLPVTFRTGAWSGRLRLYHQSSHLGDELLLNHPEVQRVSLSFEVIEALAAIDGAFWRAYGGAGLIIHSRTDLERLILRLGFDAWSEPWSVWVPVLPDFTWVISADLESFSVRGFEPTISLKAGVQLARPVLGRVALLGTALLGYLPFGQFVTTQRCHAVGVEAQIDF
ncbi:MAG: DUF1207 domain-containing protein [Deltaproteobacteria bacterium]|nr:DUF1207 domain-containing protein [Deltaproteobacteria bacterium]